MKYCIFFVVNEKYVPLLYVLLISLKKNSYKIFKSCDYIVYNDGLSKESYEILRKITNNKIKFILIDNKYFPKEIMDHHHISSSRWGKYILYKLNGFNLIKEYDKCLFLDADMLILDSLDFIFTCNEIGWREAAWCSKDPLNYNMNISAPNGGVILFSKRLLKYDINNNDILYAFNNIKNHSRGGIEERILGMICFNKNIKITKFDIKYNIWFSHHKIKNAVIVHFINNSILNSYTWYFMFHEWSVLYYQYINIIGKNKIQKKINILRKNIPHKIRLPFLLFCIFYKMGISKIYFFIASKIINIYKYLKY